MKINIQQKDNEVVVSLVGEMDTVATTKMSEEMNKVADLTNRALVIDCTDLEYISSSGLRFFMKLKKDSEQNNGSIVIRNLNDDVLEIFRLSGFHNIFDIQ
jgi:anti-sigma B factor antagonist